MKSGLEEKVTQKGHGKSKQEPEGKKRLLKAYEIYNNLANGKITDFIKAKEYITETLEQLLQEGTPMYLSPVRPLQACHP